MHARDVSQSHPELSRAYCDHPRRYCGPPKAKAGTTRPARINAAVTGITQAQPETRNIFIAVAHFGVDIDPTSNARLGVDAHAAMAHKIGQTSLFT